MFLDGPKGVRPSFVGGLRCSFSYAGVAPSVALLGFLLLGLLSGRGRSCSASWRPSCVSRRRRRMLGAPARRGASGCAQAVSRAARRRAGAERAVAAHLTCATPRSDFARLLFRSSDDWGCERCRSAVSASKLRAVPAKIEPVAIARVGAKPVFTEAENQANDLASPPQGRHRALHTRADDFFAARSAGEQQTGRAAGCPRR